MDGPTLFDPFEGDDGAELTDRLVSGDGGLPRWHPSFGAVGTDEYQRRVRLAAEELAHRRGDEHRRRLAERARRRAQQRLDDPRESVREGERSRRRLLRALP
ncbi:MAG: hypothetical protein AAGA99_09725 [Actinomycetota bacterium]